MRGGFEFPRNAARSLAVVCLAACAAVSSLGARRAIPPRIPQSAQSAPSAPSQAPAREIPADPRALYQALNELRADGSLIYTVHELDLRRDVISIKLADGKLAFLQSIGGRVTGAVFTGAGHILATPRDRGERRSLAQFLGVPILDQNFSRAYFRFTDDTAAELRDLLAADTANPAPTAKSNAPPDENPSSAVTSAAASDADFIQGWNGVIASINPSQSLRVMFDVLSAQPQPYFYAAIASDAAGIFDVLVDSRRDEQVLLGRTRIVNNFPLYDVWASFRAANNGDAASAPAAPFRAFAPLDYRVDTTIADDLTVQGKTSLHFKALRAGERVITLELSRNLVVDQVLSAAGRPLVFFQNEELSRREIPRRGNDSVMIVLPEAPAAGDEIRFDVSYRGSVITDAGNGVKFVGEHETWYAHLAGSESFVPFDLTFRWPRRLTLVATGDQIESRDEGDTKTGRWVSRVPFEVAGFNLSEYKTDSIGNGRVQVRVYANKQLEEAILARLARHDSAEAIPPPLFVPRRIPGQVEMSAPPPPPSPASVLKALGGNMLDSIEFFEKLNGPFPFDHLDVSQIPGTFGQGWPGLVYLSTLAFLPPEAEMRVGINERAQEEARELMGPHEAAHQWWGNVVDTNSYRDTWIAEGMANYLALLWVDARYPNAHRLETWLERFRRALTTPVAGSADTPDDAGPLTLGPRLHSSKIPEAYETVIYGKGTWVIHMIHQMLRDPSAKDPDARFRTLLRGILEEYRFRPLSTADFQRALEKKMTPAMDLEGSHKMEWFFDQWVRATGIPHYKVEFQVKPRGDEFVVSGKLFQSGVDDVFTAPVPLYVAHVGGRPMLLGVVATTGPETRFHFTTRARPARLQIDPHLTLLRKPD